MGVSKKKYNAKTQMTNNFPTCKVWEGGGGNKTESELKKKSGH